MKVDYSQEMEDLYKKVVRRLAINSLSNSLELGLAQRLLSISINELDYKDPLFYAKAAWLKLLSLYFNYQSFHEETSGIGSVVQFAKVFRRDDGNWLSFEALEEKYYFAEFISQQEDWYSYTLDIIPEQVRFISAEEYLTMLGSFKNLYALSSSSLSIWQKISVPAEYFYCSPLTNTKHSELDLAGLFVYSIVPKWQAQSLFDFIELLNKEGDS